MTLRPIPRVIAAAILIAAAVVPAAASAQVGREADRTTLELGGAGAKALRAQGVKVRAIVPADGTRKEFNLPVASATLAPVKLVHEGGLLLKAGKRKVRLNGMELDLSGAGSLFAAVGKGRVRVLAVRARPQVDPATRSIAIDGATARLTRRGARLLVRRLGLEKLKPGAFSTVRSRAVVPAPATGATPPPFQVGNLGAPPPVLARPGTAVDVTSVSISWHPRDSWLRYVAGGGGPGNGAVPSGGATSGASTTASPCPDRPVGPVPLVYTFGFTPTTSWRDPSGVAGIYGTGAVRFNQPVNGIDITLSNPEIELNGTESRLIFTFSGTGGTPIPTQRAVLVDLVGDGTPTSTAPDPGGGTRYTYDFVRGDLANAGSAAFGAYPPGDDYGCVSVAFTAP